MKKVLGLVASQRRLGNTEMLVKEILANTGEECTKEMIRLTDLNLECCNGCYACLPRESDCRIKDDLAFLLAKIQESDAVVIGAPVYFLGPHGVIKVLQDRLMSVGSKSHLYQGKRCVTVTTYGALGWEGYAQSVLNLTAHFCGLDLVDSLLFNAANPGEVWLNGDNLAKVQKVGRLLLDPSYRKEPSENQCPTCWGDFFRFMPDGTIYCPLCGTKGKVNNPGQKPMLRFDNSGPSRFSPEGRKKHGSFLEMKKEEFIAKRGELKELQNPYRAYDWWVKPAGS